MGKKEDWPDWLREAQLECKTIELLPAPPRYLPGWTRRRLWIEIGECLPIGPYATLMVACRLPTDWRGSPRGLSLIAHVVQGRIRRTRQVDAGQVIHLSGTWIVALAFRAVERSDNTIPRRVLAEVVPAIVEIAR